MISVNTNMGALVALQNLNKTNNELQVVQDRINSGRAINSAKDNGAVYAIAQGMRSVVTANSVVQQSLNRGVSTVDVAIAAGESIGDLLDEMRAKALAASDSTLTNEQRNAFNADFVALRTQLARVVTNASFNGVNLINNSTASYRALSNSTGAALTVAAKNLSLGGSIVTLAATASVNTVTRATAALSAVAASITNLNQALGELGTSSRALGVQRDFLSKISDALEGGVSNLVDADLARESARLQALQVKQQLGVQALSIANSSVGSVLSFFR
jgi:flagellin